ncbi:MAG: Trm112 family protein [Pseudomonadota bacterium]
MSKDTAQDAPGERASGMDPRILERLVCPLTRGPLEYDRAAGELISQKAGLAYPIRNGLALLTEKYARELGEAGG